MMKNKINLSRWWLWLIALMLVTMPMSAAYVFLSKYVVLLHNGVLRLLTTQGTYAYHPLWFPLLSYETLNLIVFLLLDVYALVLFFRKKKSFPKVFSCLFIQGIVSNVVFFAGRYVIFQSYELSFEGTFGVMFYVSLVFVCLFYVWIIWALLRSKAVKQIFVID